MAILLCTKNQKSLSIITLIYLNALDEKRNKEEYSIEQNVARCARISYLMDSKDVSGDVELYHKLQLHKHGSAFEHVCRPMTPEEFKNLTRSFYEGEKFFSQEGWCANIRGFLSQRTILGL